MKVLSLLCGVAIAPLAFNAVASVEIKFLEGAPKDRFVVLNTGDCDLSSFTLEFDLSETQGGLIFDTTADGAGVEVFQPFETQASGVTLVSADAVIDGDKSLTIRVDSLPAQDQLSFTIDVDDTLTNSALGQIRVADSEMRNGSITLKGIGTGEFNTVFDAKSHALIAVDLCTRG